MLVTTVIAMSECNLSCLVLLWGNWSSLGLRRLFRAAGLRSQRWWVGLPGNIYTSKTVIRAHRQGHLTYILTSRCHQVQTLDIHTYIQMSADAKSWVAN